DPAVADPHITAHDSPVIQHDDVRDHGVQRPLGAGCHTLCGGLPDAFPTSEHGFVAARAVVLLDLDPQVGVSQPDLITGSGAVELGVLAAVDLAHCHSSRVGSADGSDSGVSLAVPVTLALARGGGCGLSSGSAPGVPNGTTL